MRVCQSWESKCLCGVSLSFLHFHSFSMENNTERKKRKMENEGGEEYDQEHQEQKEQDNEEEKMEQFSALIRNTKDMRDRLRAQQQQQQQHRRTVLLFSSSGGSRDYENRVEQQEAKPPPTAAWNAAWNPTFQPEDFMDDVAIRSKINITPHDYADQLGSPSKQKQGEETTAGAATTEAGKEAAGKSNNRNDHDHLDLNLSL